MEKVPILHSPSIGPEDRRHDIRNRFLSFFQNSTEENNDRRGRAPFTLSSLKTTKHGSSSLTAAKEFLLICEDINMVRREVEKLNSPESQNISNKGASSRLVSEACIKLEMKLDKSKFDGDFAKERREKLVDLHGIKRKGDSLAMDLFPTDEEIEAAFGDSLFEHNDQTGYQRNEVIDPLFEKLVWIDEREISKFQVNEQAIRTLFQINAPLRVHACIGHYATSSLISKLLEFAVSKFNSSNVSTEEICGIFSSKSEGVTQKCIVAWGQSIPGELLDGKVVHHVFLDIWGKFETDDPLYLIFAGICAAMTTSVIFIQKIELEDSVLMWIHNVALIARKIIGDDTNLEKLIFFVNDWSQPESFMPGARGGRDYLNSIFSSSSHRTELASSRIQHLQTLISSMFCYLMPFKSGEVSYIQHWNISKLFLLHEGSGSDIGLPTKDFSRLDSTLQSLETLSYYLDFLTESQTKQSWIEDTKHCESTRDVEPKSKYLNKQYIDDSKDLTEEFLQDSMNEFPFSHSNDNLFADCFDFRKHLDEFSFEPDFSSYFEEDKLSQTNTLTLEEYLSSKVTSDCSEKQHVNEESAPTALHAETAESNVRCQESTEVASQDDLLRKLKEYDPFSKVGRIVKVPSIKIPDFLQKASQNCHKRESVSSSSSSNGVILEIENHIESLAGGLNVSVLPTVILESNGNEQNGNHDTKETTLTELPPEIINLILEILQTMDLQQIFATDLNSFVADAIQNATLRGIHVIHTARQMLIPFIKLVFSNLNNYINEMDSVFHQNVYFPDPKELEQISQDLQQRTCEINLELLKSPEWQSLFSRLKLQLEQFYLKINEEITKFERENLEYSMNLATEYYENELKLSISSSTDEILAKSHQNLSEQCRNAWLYAYNRPELTTSHIIQEFDTRIESSYHRLVSEFRMQKDSEEIRRIIEEVSSNFLTEIKRNLPKDYLLHSESEFVQECMTIRENVMKTTQAKMLLSLSPKTLAEVNKCLEVKFDDIQQQVMLEYFAQKRTREVINASQTSTKMSMLKNPENKQQKNVLKSSPQPEKNSVIHQIGVDFGFEHLSAVLLSHRGEYRNVFGPHPNILTVQGNELLIGQHASFNNDYTTGSSTVLRMSTLLNILDIENPIEMRGRKSCRIEVVIAEILSKLHMILVESLHTEDLVYTIAVPSTFNPIMMRVMSDAIEIAGLQATITRNTYSLVSKFLFENSQLIKAKNTTLIVIIENADDSADACCFTVEKNEVKPTLLLGFDHSTTSKLNPMHWVNKLTSGSNSCLGITRVMNHILPKMTSNGSFKLVLQCSNQNLPRNTEIIKKGSVYNSNWKLHSYSNSQTNVAEGAALVGGYKHESRFKDHWIQVQGSPKLGPTILDINVKVGRPLYRIAHSGFALHQLDINEASEEIKTEREQIRTSLLLEKSKARKEFMKKCHEVQDQNYNNPIVEEAEIKQKQLSNLLKIIDVEFQSPSYVKKILTEMESL